MGLSNGPTLMTVFALTCNQSETLNTHKICMIKTYNKKFQTK